MSHKPKYKQPYIPQVDDVLFHGLQLGKLKTFVSEYANASIVGKKVINQHKGITVQISKKGIRHLLFARNPGYIKLKATMKLPELIEVAEYTNFNPADADDTEGVLGYLNFRVLVQIEGEIQRLRIVVRLTVSGKFYYDHVLRLSAKQ